MTFNYFSFLERHKSHRFYPIRMNIESLVPLKLLTRSKDSRTISVSIQLRMLSVHVLRAVSERRSWKNDNQTKQCRFVYFNTVVFACYRYCQHTIHNRGARHHKDALVSSSSSANHPIALPMMASKRLK